MKSSLEVFPVIAHISAGQILWLGSSTAHTSHCTSHCLPDFGNELSKVLGNLGFGECFVCCFVFSPPFLPSLDITSLSYKYGSFPNLP